ncbi:hypothetical protein ANN_27089 [Periplaneta americana]|uniref:Reverse transcriptase domain-containing protein n=1 Tax=Periplaneta americana TaxID=6978 RepID=A0ABQ8RXA9_PERAM|nr:hypothetical protein ANN_27089 [Periplaneta americana]
MATKIVRQHTLRATFDKEQQRPTALDVHRWIDEVLKIKDEELQTIQLVGKQNAAYLKFTSSANYERYVQRHTGTSVVELLNGATTTVTITPAEDDYVSVRVLNIPPEVPNDRIRNTLQNFGKVLQIENEKWSHRYRYKIDTGIRVVQMSFAAYLPNRSVKMPINTVPRTRLTFSDILQTHANVTTDVSEDGIPPEICDVPGPSNMSTRLVNADNQNKPVKTNIENELHAVTDKPVGKDGTNRVITTYDVDKTQKDNGTVTQPIPDSDTDSAEELPSADMHGKQKTEDTRGTEKQMGTKLNNSAIGKMPKKKQDNSASTANTMKESGDLSNSPDNIQNISSLQSGSIPTSISKNLQHTEDWYQQMEQDDTTNTQFEDKGQQNVKKTITVTRHRTHPYKGKNMLLAIITLQMSLVAIVGTLNFHGNSSPVKMKLLNIFLRTNDVDVLFLQEVKTNDFSEIYGYTAYVNVGSESLGTAILTRNGIDLHSVEKLPSGKGISDFQRAFDCVSHKYLFEVLAWHGLNPTFIGYLKCLYTDISAVIQINGFLTAALPITRSIRQGCPASMILFALALNPLLYLLHEKLSGYRIGNSRLVATAYADDVSAIINNEEDKAQLEKVLKPFAAVSGECLVSKLDFPRHEVNVSCGDNVTTHLENASMTSTHNLVCLLVAARGMVRVNTIGLASRDYRRQECERNNSKRKSGRQERSRDNLNDIQEYSRKRNDTD